MKTTTCKKSTKSLIPFHRHWLFAILEKRQINKITQPFPEISAVYYGESWACLRMPDQTQKILHDLTKASMDT